MSAISPDALQEAIDREIAGAHLALDGVREKLRDAQVRSHDPRQTKELITATIYRCEGLMADLRRIQQALNYDGFYVCPRCNARKPITHFQRCCS